MHIKRHKVLSYANPEQFLVVSRQELSEMIDASGNLSEFVAAVNAAAEQVGADIEHSNYWAGGVRSIKLWLDGVTDDDTTRLVVGIFTAQHKSRGNAVYLRRGRGFVVCCESHCTVG